MSYFLLVAIVILVDAVRIPVPAFLGHLPILLNNSACPLVLMLLLILFLPFSSFAWRCDPTSMARCWSRCLAVSGYLQGASAPGDLCEMAQRGAYHSTAKSQSSSL